MASAIPIMHYDTSSAPYELRYDRACGMIFLRSLRDITDADAPRLCRDLEPMVAEMRAKHGDIRMMFDLRATALILGVVAAKMTETLYRERASGDRFAVLLGSSVMKAEARPSLDAQTQVFMSETAARTWLHAWTGKDDVAQHVAK